MNTSSSLVQSPWIRPFFPTLDGLRAIAFLLVFLHHFGTLTWAGEVWKWGWVGVDIFFVLSGFLITGILYDSLQSQHYFTNFYMRRTLRIFPLFFGFWILIGLLTPILHIVWNRYNLSAMVYLGNFFLPASRLGLHANPLEIAYLSHRHAGQIRYISLDTWWSLCVEEQFYLVWPALIWLMRSRKALLQLCLVVIAVLPVARFVYFRLHPEWVSVGGLYSASWARVDTLLVGAALALWLRGPSWSLEKLRPLCWSVAMGAPLLLAAAYIGAGQHGPIPAYDPVVDTIGLSLVALASGALLLLVIDPDARWTIVLRKKPLVVVGRLSYGMYLFHGLLAPLMKAAEPKLHAHHLALLALVLPFAVTLTFASLSFRYWESPFLRLKARFDDRPHAVQDPPAVGEPLRLRTPA
jgi:peptidoglycan/LPS O-acetylase OafA/YrhL